MLLGAASEGMKVSPVEKFQSLVLYMCPQRVRRPETGLVVMASGVVFRHKERAPIEYIRPRCKSATMKDYIIFGCNRDIEFTIQFKRNRAAIILPFQSFIVGQPTRYANLEDSCLRHSYNSNERSAFCTLFYDWDRIKCLPLKRVSLRVNTFASLALHMVNSAIKRTLYTMVMIYGCVALLRSIKLYKS